jgi:hypothetical protein
MPEVDPKWMREMEEFIERRKHVVSEEKVKCIVNCTCLLCGHEWQRRMTFKATGDWRARRNAQKERFMNYRTCERCEENLELYDKEFLIKMLLTLAEEHKPINE